MKKIVCFALTVIFAFALPVFASADNEILVDTTWTGKIVAGSVNLRITPEMYSGNNVIGILSGGDRFNLLEVAPYYGNDNSEAWRHVEMTSGANMDNRGYVAARFTEVYPPGYIEPYGF